MASREVREVGVDSIAVQPMEHGMCKRLKRSKLRMVHLGESSTAAEALLASDSSIRGVMPNGSGAERWAVDDVAADR